ncbi:MAG: hypothetical protein IAF58_19305 [Leptolyngbya sp.]|nr:hypothetical protein [Candidatus Melainabacteria bacterium]
MQHLQNLIGAGYKHGYSNGHGADDTVSGLEWAIRHLDCQPDTAVTYSAHATSNLESRLFAGYVVRCLAFIKVGSVDKAKIEYHKAAALAALSRQSHGLLPSLSADQIAETLAVVEHRFRSAGANL